MYSCVYRDLLSSAMRWEITEESVYSRSSGVTGLMKMVRRHLRQASINFKSGDSNPCNKAGIIWQSRRDLTLFSVPMARLPRTTAHSVLSSVLELSCWSKYSNLGTAPKTIKLAFCLLFPITAFFISMTPCRTFWGSRSNNLST